MGLRNELVKQFSADSQNDTIDVTNVGGDGHVTLTFHDDEGDMSAFTVEVYSSADGGVTYEKCNADIDNTTSPAVVRLAVLTPKLKLATNGTFTGTTLSVYASWVTAGS